MLDIPAYLGQLELGDTQHGLLLLELETELLCLVIEGLGLLLHLLHLIALLEVFLLQLLPEPLLFFLRLDRFSWLMDVWKRSRSSP